MSVITVNKDNFEKDVLQAKGPVLVDFWAEWCGPCKMISPALEEIAQEMNGKITIAKLNIDENPELAAKFGIRSIPTLLIFNNGSATHNMVGAAPKSRLAEWINTAL